MTTVANMVAARDTAGARYLSALQELRAAYIDLAAIDKALSNRNFGVQDGSQLPIVTFSGIQAQEGVPQGLRHPKYAPDALGGWDKDTEEQFQIYLSQLAVG